MSRFDEIAGLAESHSPMLGVRLRDLGQLANTHLSHLKRAASTGTPSDLRDVVGQLDKVIGEMNGIAKRL